MKKIITVFIAVLVIAAGYTATLGFREKKLIFHPKKELALSPLELNLVYEDIYLTTPDQLKLHGWFFPNKEAQKTVLFFHGNAGNVSSQLEIVEFYLKKLGTQVFVIDYRGFGKSEGEPSEMGIYQDGQTAFTYLAQQKNIPEKSIVIVGQSLGGTVAVDVASKVKHGGLILENTFTSALDMAKVMYPYLPVKWVVKSRFDSEAKIKMITTPKLIIHGTHDETVPFRFGQRLFEVAPEPKLFYAVQGATHGNNYIVGGSSYENSLRQFITSF